MQELEAALTRCAVADGSTLARLRGDGPDLPGLLHRLSTGDVRSWNPGGGGATVLTSAKGRIIERLFVTHHGPRGLLLIGGPGRGEAILGHLARYTLGEQTGLRDITAETCQLLLVGPAAPQALEAAGLSIPERFGVHRGTLDGVEIDLLGHDDVGGDGFSVVGDAAADPTIRTALERAVADAGGVTVSAGTLEARRIRLGLPAAGGELTEEYNPLEAGLRDAVSFDKGCYVGQEVVARLNTYDKVSRQLIGVRFDDTAPAPELPASIVHQGKEVGRMTSAIQPGPSEATIGLALIKHRQVEPEAAVEIEGRPARLCSLER